VRHVGKDSRTQVLKHSRMQERGDVDLGARLLVLLEFINFELGFLSSLLGKGQNKNLDDKYPENHCQQDL